jgi:hypothetical protein
MIVSKVACKGRPSHMVVYPIFFNDVISFFPIPNFSHLLYIKYHYNVFIILHFKFLFFFLPVPKAQHELNVLVPCAVQHRGCVCWCACEHQPPKHSPGAGCTPCPRTAEGLDAFGLRPDAAYRRYLPLATHSCRHYCSTASCICWSSQAGNLGFNSTRVVLVGLFLGLIMEKPNFENFLPPLHDCPHEKTLAHARPCPTAHSLISSGSPPPFGFLGVKWFCLKGFISRSCLNGVT